MMHAPTDSLPPFKPDCFREGPALKIALCTNDQTEYEASTFAAKAVGWIDENRLHLQCIVCESPAYFRKKSKSGQAACFGARPHLDGCQLATESNEESERAAAVETFIKTNPGKHFVLRLGHPRPAKPKTPVAGIPVRDSGKTAASFVKWGRRQESGSTIGAKECLINLVVSDVYAKSTQTIALTRTSPDIAIRDFFVPFRGAIIEPSGTMRGYWGSLTATHENDDGSAWLNTGRPWHMSVLLSRDVKEELLQAYQVDDIEDLAGCYALVIGRLTQARGGKWYVKPAKARNTVLYSPEGTDVIEA
jgi:hypothetical protein